jgi:hypothetical protein
VQPLTRLLIGSFDRETLRLSCEVRSVAWPSRRLPSNLYHEKLTPHIDLCATRPSSHMSTPGKIGG